MTFGYAYDGRGEQLVGTESYQEGFVRPEGDLLVDLTPGEDKGIVAVLLSRTNSCDGVRWTRFEPAATYHEGGVARDVGLHGASGNDGPDFPAVTASLAAWGTATVYANGGVLAPLPEPESDWDAHLMILERGIRENARILVDGAAYAPSAAGKAPVVGGGREAHLRLVHSGPEDNGFDLRDYQYSDAVTGLDYRRAFPLSTPFQNGELRFEVSTKSTLGDPASKLRFALRYEGKDIEAVELQGSRVKAALVAPVQGNGKFEVVVTGNSTGQTYSVAGVFHVDELVINMWWESVERADEEWADRAAASAPSRRLCPPM